MWKAASAGRRTLSHSRCPLNLSHTSSPGSCSDLTLPKAFLYGRKQGKAYKFTGLNNKGSSVVSKIDQIKYSKMFAPPFAYLPLKLTSRAWVLRMLMRNLYISWKDKR